MQRRTFLTGLAALITAPAIVRAGSLMPVRSVVEPLDHYRGYSAMMIEFRKQITREYIRANLFTPYMGDSFGPLPNITSFPS